MYCEEAEKTYEGDATLNDGSELTARAKDKEEFDSIVAEINTRIDEMQNELDQEKSYLSNLFKKDTSAPAKEDQTDEDEFTDEDRQEIYDYFNDEVDPKEEK